MCDMTVNDYIQHVQTSIDRALRHDSAIDASILNLKGFSTGIQRRLISNLCHIPVPDPVYVEIGAFFGGTACAAFNNAKDLTTFIVEDYSQPFGEQGVRESLLSSIDTYRSSTKSVTLIEADCFNMDLSLITKPITILNYDAVHDEWAQRKAWSHFVYKLDDVAIVTVDDFSWLAVSRGSRDGINDVSHKLKVEKEWFLWDGVPDSPIWHNGVAIFVVKKL